MDTDGMKNWDDHKYTDKSKNDYSKDGSGWNGKTVKEDETGWGKYWEGKDYEKERKDRQFFKNKTEVSVEDGDTGYGLPSKGKYSMMMGGYKSFGTEGQGEDGIGAKDDNATTCSDRVMLITVTANEDTGTNAASASTTSGSSHPIVMSGEESWLELEVGNYYFLDDLVFSDGSSTVESAMGLRVFASLASLLAISMFA